MWRQAMAKTDGDADVAAVLIHDAATGFAKVTETYEVKLRKVREAVKLQKQVVKALKQHYQDDYNSTHMKSFSGASDIKWDQLRQCMGRKVEPNGDHRDLNLSDLDPELSSEVGTPSFLCSKTCAKERTAIGKELGMKVLEEDGSAVQVMLLNRAIKESLLRKGLHRAKREVNEQIVGGDAVGIFKSGRHKATYVSVKSTGSTPYANSPRTLFPLVQWLGGDDFHHIQAQCGGVIEEMNRQIRDGGMWVTPPSSYEGSDDEDVAIDLTDPTTKGKVFCKTKMMVSADGAMIMAAEGGVGFCGKYPCPWCMVTSDQLGVEQEFPLKTHKFLCNASHMPSHLGPDGAFPFDCPICAKRFINQAAVDAEDEFEGNARLNFQRLHDQVHKHPALFPLDPEDVNICTLHMLMGSQKHVWKHGISDDITGRGAAGQDKAKAIMEKLLTKCGIVMNIEKVGKGSSAKCVKLVSLGGAQARAVCAHFEMFLQIVYGFGEDYDRDHPPIGTKNADAVSFKKKAYVGDKLLDLWNCVATRMHDRTDENGNRLPGTPEEVKLKAEELRLASKMYRAAYRAAFGVEAFKPYTHATYHLHQFQLKLQYDLKDYSTEAQEHQGKQMKMHTKSHSNGRLSVPDKNGKIAKGYTQQSSESYSVKRHAEAAHPDLVNQDWRRKKNRDQEEIQKRISKQTVWCADVCDHELSRNVGKKLKGAGTLV